MEGGIVGGCGDALVEGLGYAGGVDGLGVGGGMRSGDSCGNVIGGEPVEDV